MSLGHKSAVGCLESRVCFVCDKIGLPSCSVRTQALVERGKAANARARRLNAKRFLADAQCPDIVLW